MRQHSITDNKHQILRKFGFLFSTNAERPSLGPALLKSPWKMEASYSKPWSKVVSRATFTAFFAAYKESRGLLTMTLRYYDTFYSNLSDGKTLAMFNRPASAAVIVSPERMYLVASFVPMILGRI